MSRDPIPRTPLQVAETYLGLTEIPGDEHDPIVLGMLQSVKQHVGNDEVAWCSAFIHACCRPLGLPVTNSLRARSWLRLGTAIDLANAQPGFDLVILRRNGSTLDPNVINVDGHVGWFVALDGENVSHSSTTAAPPPARPDAPPGAALESAPGRAVAARRFRPRGGGARRRGALSWYAPRPFGGRGLRSADRVGKSAPQSASPVVRPTRRPGASAGGSKTGRRPRVWSPYGPRRIRRCPGTASCCSRPRLQAAQERVDPAGLASAGKPMGSTSLEDGL